MQPCCNCSFRVLRNSVFLVPGTHADKPSAQKSFLSQFGICSIFWSIRFVRSAVLFWFWGFYWWYDYVSVLMVFAQFNYLNIYQVLQPTFFQTKCKQICTVNIPDEPRFLGMQWTRCPDLKVQLEQKVLAVHCSAQMLSKDAIEREAYGRLDWLFSSLMLFLCVTFSLTLER